MVFSDGLNVIAQVRKRLHQCTCAALVGWIEADEFPRGRAAALGRGMVGFELYHHIVQGVPDLVLEPVSFVCKPPLEGIGEPIEIVKQAFGVVVRLSQHVNPADILIEAHVILVKLDQSGGLCAANALESVEGLT